LVRPPTLSTNNKATVHRRSITGGDVLSDRFKSGDRVWHVVKGRTGEVIGRTSDGVTHVMSVETYTIQWDDGSLPEPMVKVNELQFEELANRTAELTLIQAVETNRGECGADAVRVGFKEFTAHQGCPHETHLRMLLEQRRYKVESVPPVGEGPFHSIRVSRQGGPVTVEEVRAILKLSEALEFQDGAENLG